MDIQALENKLRLVTGEVRDAARDAALQIEGAQTDVDTETGTLVKLLGDLDQAEAAELARHADILADLRMRREAALKQHQAAIADTSVRMRALRSQLIGTDQPHLRLAVVGAGGGGGSGV